MQPVVMLVGSGIFMFAVIGGISLLCNAALCSRRKKHFIFDSINTITAPSFR